MKNSFVKRLCVLLIILCMILPSIPVSAAYVTDVTSPVHLATSGAETKILSEYTDTDKLREYLISELQQCKDTIDIAQFNIPESASSDLQLFIWREIPECFHVNTLGRYTGNPIPAIIVTYFYEKEEYLTMLSECKAVADKLLDGIKDNDELSDVLKALLIHDRLAVHNEYDYDFESGCYNMYASLVKRRSVCDGYTAAYLYLLRQVGIECVSCLSDKLNHSWVLVKLDGEYYHVDVTWDDPTWNVGERGVLGYAAHNNFLRSNTGIYQTNHNENDYYAPATSTKYDAYFWQSTNASFVLADGDIYYIDGTEQKLMKLNDDGVTGTPICSVEGIWSAPGGSVWIGNFSKLDTDGHRLFFTTADTVYMYDPATNKTKAVYKPELTGIEAIYGFDYSDGYLICDINTRPSGDVTELRQVKTLLTQYTVKFLDHDGTVLSERQYDYGDTVVVPANPTRQADETYTYTFKGWDKTVTTVNGDATYTAVYDETFIDYTVIFLDHDGSKISEKTYHFGADIDVPAGPTREADETYTYTFKGWDKDVSATCNGSVTYTAVYDETFIDYTVTFLDHDGSKISEKTYHYGADIDVPADPTREADETYTYTFKSWDKDVSATCNGSVTYTAVYDETLIDYTVTFLDHDGSKISEKTYHYGADIDVPAGPTRQADETYTYTFKGWDKDVSATCNGSVTYTAVYDETFIDYTVIFLDHDGSKISEKTYHFGADIEVPADPTRQADETYTYTFKGWDKDVSATCSGSVTYTAVYDKTEKAVRKPGDMNDDGRENNKDVVFLFRFVSRYDGSDFDTIYDFNGDGKVNNKDVVALFRYVSSAA